MILFEMYIQTLRAEPNLLCFTNILYPPPWMVPAWGTLVIWDGVIFKLLHITEHIFHNIKLKIHLR